jgi:hypothetical protein
VEHARKCSESTIASLHKLNLLVLSMAQLQECQHNKDFAHSAAVLQGVLPLWAEFEPHAKHERLKPLAAAINGVKHSLWKDIRPVLYVRRTEPRWSVEGCEYKGACAVLGVLGGDTLGEYITWLAKDHLEGMDDLWPNDCISPFGLEAVQSILAWACERIGDYGTRYDGAHDAAWFVQYKIGMAFCERFSQALSVSMSDSVAGLSQHTIAAMLAAVAEFEQATMASGPPEQNERKRVIAAWARQPGQGSDGKCSRLSECIAAHLHALGTPSRQASHVEDLSESVPVLSGFNLFDDSEILDGDTAVSHASAAGEPWYWRVEGESLRLAAYESLLLCTLLDSDFVPTASDLSALDEIRTPLEVSKRKHKAIVDHLRLEVKEGEPEVVQTTTFRYRLRLLQEMRPHRFTDADSPESFVEWRRRQLAVIGAGMAAVLQPFPNKLFTIDQQDMKSSEVLDALGNLIDEICEFDSTSRQMWEVCDSMYTETLESLANHVGAVLSRLHAASPAYPTRLGTQLYEALLMSCFDSEEDGSLFEGHEAMLALISHVQKSLGIRPWAWVWSAEDRAQPLAHRCAFAKGTLAVYRRFGKPDALSSLLTQLGEIERVFAHGHTEYEVQVLREISAVFAASLSTYFTAFAEKHTELARSIAIHLAMKALLTDGRSAAPSAEAEVAELIRASVIQQYEMMKREAEGEFGYGAAALAAVVDGIMPMLAEQRKFEVALRQFHARPTAACCEHLLAMLKVDVTHVIRRDSTLEHGAVLLLHSMYELQGTLAEPLRGADTSGLSAHFVNLDALFSPRAEVWIESQKMQLMECLERACAAENWEAVTETELYSHSAVDMFAMVAQTVPKLFELGIPVSLELAQSLIQGVDDITVKYANWILRSCGSKISLENQGQESSRQVQMQQQVKNFFNLKRHLDEAKKEMGEKKGLLKRIAEIGGQSTLTDAEDSRLKAQTLEDLTVRLANLAFARQQLTHLETELGASWHAMLVRPKRECGRGWHPPLVCDDLGPLFQYAEVGSATPLRIIMRKRARALARTRPRSHARTRVLEDPTMSAAWGCWGRSRLVGWALRRWG